MDFSVLTELATLLVEKPWTKDLLAERYPQEWDAVVRLAQAPFLRMRPFETEPGKGDAQVGFVLSSSYNKWAHAGNRAGKTCIGLYEDLCDALHLHPLHKRPHNRFEGAPRSVTIWVVSDTEDTTVDVLEKTMVQDLLGADTSGIMWNMVRDECSYAEVGGFKGHYLGFTNGSEIYFKYSSQGRKVFQGAAIHKIHHDEVQPRDIYSECQARLVDYNGYFMGTMTPIFDKTKGMPWIRDLYLNRSSKNIEWHTWTLLDNPHLSAEAKKRIVAEWSEEEKEARIYGGFVPLGLTMAFPTPLLRQLRSRLARPTLGHLDWSESQPIRFVPQERRWEVEAVPLS